MEIYHELFVGKIKEYVLTHRSDHECMNIRFTFHSMTKADSFVFDKSDRGL